MTQRTMNLNGDKLTIKSHDMVRTYKVKHVGTLCGLRAYTVDRTSDVGTGPGRYRVTVSTRDGKGYCDCPAGKWGKPCVHADALVKLVEIGRV